MKKAAEEHLGGGAVRTEGEIWFLWSTVEILLTEATLASMIANFSGCGQSHKECSANAKHRGYH